MLIMLLQTALTAVTSAAAADWPEFVELHTGEWFSLGNHRFNATVSANAVATLPAGVPVRVRAHGRDIFSRKIYLQYFFVIHTS